jgi:hypothetical protein
MMDIGGDGADTRSKFEEAKVELCAPRRCAESRISLYRWRWTRHRWPCRAGEAVGIAMYHLPLPIAADPGVGEEEARLPGRLFWSMVTVHNP